MDAKEAKEMIYQKERIVELLYNDFYKGYHYYILSLGTHPTAYIEIPKKNILYEKDYDEIYKMGIYPPVNGGLTYSDGILWISENTLMRDSWYIGWDYGHCCDYYGGFNDKINKNNKKWTTKEIIEECQNAIDYLIIELEKRNDR